MLRTIKDHIFYWFYWFFFDWPSSNTVYDNGEIIEYHYFWSGEWTFWMGSGYLLMCCKRK